MQQLQKLYNQNKNEFHFSKREKLFNEFVKLGLPFKKNESWKYTNLNHFLAKEQNQSLEIFNPITVEIIKKYLNTNTTDSNICEIHDFISTDTKFKIFAHFAEIFTKDPVYLHTLSCLNNGQVIHLKENQKLDKPIFIELKNNTQFVYIIAENNFSGELVFIENLKNLNTNYSTQIILVENKENSNLTINQINLNDTSVNANNYFFARLQQNAKLAFNELHLGGSLTRKNNYISLEKPHAHFKHNILVQNGHDQHTDINSEICVKASHTQANQLCKMLLSQKAHGIFNGLVKVEKNLKDVNTTQLNKNILIDSTSHVHSQPRLEVFSDDVKCSHGSSTGRLSQNELFYLEARGIKPERARQLLTQGFLNEVLEQIQFPPFRDDLKNNWNKLWN